MLDVGDRTRLTQGPSQKRDPPSSRRKNGQDDLIRSRSSLSALAVLGCETRQSTQENGSDSYSKQRQEAVLVSRGANRLLFDATQTRSQSRTGIIIRALNEGEMKKKAKTHLQLAGLKATSRETEVHAVTVELVSLASR